MKVWYDAIELPGEVESLGPRDMIEWLFANLTDVELAAYEEQIEWQRYGSLQNYPRLAAVAEYCAARYPGDLIEIGCLHGDATRLFCAVARKYDRRVVCIDPWEYNVGDPYYEPGKEHYKLFCDAIAKWRDIVDVMRMSSLDPRVVAEIKERPLCFAYQDGLHTREGVTSDLDVLSHCAGVIAVDDIVRYNTDHTDNDETRLAFYEGAGRLLRYPMTHYLCREGYLLPGAT